MPNYLRGDSIFEDRRIIPYGGQRMKVTNKTSFTLKAFTWGPKVGSTLNCFSSDVLVEPGEQKEIPGPHAGMMGGKECRLVVEGEVVCKETSDDANGYQILKDLPLVLATTGPCGVTVRHYLDEREPETL